MSRVRYSHIDLVCDRLHKTRVFLGSDEDLPPCSATTPEGVCGARTYPKDEGRDTLDPTLAQFGSVLYDGQRLTREQLEQKRKEFAAHQGVDPDTIAFVPRGNSKAIAEEHRHRAIETRRKNGFDEQQFRDYQREQRRKKELAQERGRSHR